MAAETTDFFYTSEDGLRLHVTIHGNANPGLPVVCLPGLTRNARDFANFAAYLAAGAKTPRRVLCFDYRGRGLSQYDSNWKTYDVGIETRDVLTGLAALGITEASFVGTSRGGLITLILAAIRPDVLKAVVLNDIGPVVSPEGLLHIRDYLNRSGRAANWDDAVSQLKAIHGRDFTALGASDWSRMADAIHRDSPDGPRPDYDPALLNTLKDLDLTKPLPDLWQAFEAMKNVPMLAIRGETSRLLSTETLGEMARRHSRLQSVTVKGQGHAPLLETGDLPAMIAAFIDSAAA